MSITYLPGKEPHPRETRRILKNINREGWNTSIDCYLADGGYEELKKALGMEPKAVIDEVKKSGLRGRGGAGFPTGVKWTFIPPNNTKPVYLVCNCDESEPGTFKDRYIVHQDPHQLIEGMVISSYAVGAHLAYIYMREEFPIAAETMLKALQEARERGFLGKNILGSGYDLEIHLHRGAGAPPDGKARAVRKRRGALCREYLLQRRRKEKFISGHKTNSFYDLSVFRSLSKKLRFCAKLPANRACGPVRRARRPSAVASLCTPRH